MVSLWNVEMNVMGFLSTHSIITPWLFTAICLQCSRFSSFTARRAFFMFSCSVQLHLHHSALDIDRDLVICKNCPSVMFVLCQKVALTILNMSCSFLDYQLRHLPSKWRVKLKWFYSKLNRFQGNVVLELQSVLPQNQGFIKVYILFQSVQAAKFAVQEFQNPINFD